MNFNLIDIPRNSDTAMLRPQEALIALAPEGAQMSLSGWRSQIRERSTKKLR